MVEPRAVRWSPATVRASGVRSVATLARGRLGQTEVEDLCLVALGDEEIRGFEIAVDDAARCAASSASAICSPREVIFSMDNACRSIAALTVSPRNRSITRNGLPSYTPMSCTLQMCG